MASQEERSSPIEKIAEDEPTVTKDPLKAEEEKFKQMYPTSRISNLLQKRLHKGMKYFDSGDYNMAKESARKKGQLGQGGFAVPTAGSAKGPTMLQTAQEKALLQESTGDTIATPENVPARKTSTCITTQGVHPITMRAGLQS